MRATAKLEPTVMPDSHRLVMNHETRYVRHASNDHDSLLWALAMVGETMGFEFGQPVWNAPVGCWYVEYWT